MIEINGLPFGTGFTGVIGPRGAGKTRLLQRIASVDTPCAEKVRYVTQELESFASYTVKEYLQQAAAELQLSQEDADLRIEQVFKRMQFQRWSDQEIQKVPRVIKVKTLLAKALLSDPHFLLLDGVLEGLQEEERMLIGYLLSELAKERNVVLAGAESQAVEGLFDSVCLLHPEKRAVHVPTNTAYAWVEGKVWEYVASEAPQTAEGHIVVTVKQAEDGVYVREIASSVAGDEASQVTPTLQDVYLWWSSQHE
jgi:ABC-2 type transport system ATP-binding protein